VLRTGYPQWDLINLVDPDLDCKLETMNFTAGFLLAGRRKETRLLALVMGLLS
jgi:hypothetical protein